MVEHDKRQNEINKVIRTLFNDIRRDIYEIEHLYLRSMTGCYSYEVYNNTTNISITDDNTETCKYWVLYENQLCHEEDLDYSNNFFMHYDHQRKEDHIYAGYTPFHRVFKYMTLMRECKEKLHDDENFVVYFPHNENMTNRAYTKYIKFIQKRIPNHKVVLDSLDNIEFNNEKTLVFTIDLVTSFERQVKIVNEILTKTNGKGYICILSLLKILNREEALFVINNNAISEYLKKEASLYHRNKREESVREVLSTKIEYDDEESIMRSLSGYGADPEIWGY